MERIQQQKTYPFLQGGGEMGTIIRNYNWADTTLGTPDQWPYILRASVSNMLNTGLPMLVLWGNDFRVFYNDKVIHSLDTNKHPAIFKPAKDVWTDSWPFIDALLQKVINTGEPVTFQDQPIVTHRNGKTEDVYWTFCYSLIQDDEGEPGGILVTCMETTHTVLAQIKLAESEVRFRMLIEEAPVATCVFVGEDLVMEVINQPMLEIFGKGDDLQGMRLTEAVPELTNQPFPDILRSVLRTGETYSAVGAKAELFKAGRWGTYYFDFTYKPLCNAAGEVYAILNMAIDVTERVLASKKVEASQRSLLQLFEESPVGIATLGSDEAFVIETANAFYSSLVGRQPDQIIGKPLLEALPELKGQGFDDLLKGVVATGMAYSAMEVPVTISRKEVLEVIYVNLTYQPRKQDGKVVGILVVAIDVTGLVESRKKIELNERQLETAFEQIQLSKEAAELGTFDMELETGYMHWDERCRTLFGISHQEPVSFDIDFIKRLHPDDQQRVVEVVNRAFDKSVSNGNYDVEYRTIGAEDGIVRWVRAKGKVYFNALDKPLRFIGSVIDITDQVTAIQKIEKLVEARTRELAQANDALHHTNENLKRSNAYLGEFAHAASHDLKEPIRKIQTFASRLNETLNDRMDQREIDLFHRMQAATQRMALLVDDLLTYSEISASPIQMEEVDLAEKLQVVLTDLEVQIEEKKAVFNIDGLPIVKGYKRQLQQLFQNLVGNALKYSKKDVPPQIKIRSSIIQGAEAQENLPMAKANATYHLIEVEDNGIGFEQQYAERIFSMFQRLHGKSEYEGTGIGLSIVRKVVDNHNGFIWAESKPGEGSTFMVLLPVA